MKLAGLMAMNEPGGRRGRTMPAEWIQTRLGQEMAEAVKGINRSLRSLLEPDKATKEEAFKRRVAEKAWELFKKEVDKAELIPCFGDGDGVTDEQLKHYANGALRAARIFEARAEE
jgi:hypothetical protein